MSPEAFVMHRLNKGHGAARHDFPQGKLDRITPRLGVLIRGPALLSVGSYQSDFSPRMAKPNHG